MTEVSVEASTLMRRGATRRCAVCGEGHLFRHWVQMVPRCPRCGFTFLRAPGQWLGSWFLNICVAQSAVVLILVVSVGFTWPDPPMVVIATAAGVAAVGVPFLFFPYSRTLWVAIDLVMEPLAFDDGVAPGFELEDDRRRMEAERGDDGHGHAA